VDAVLLVLSTAAASAVEMVEALTVVLAVGVTRGWRSARWGSAAALLALAIVVVILGPALSVIPIDTLRLVVGTILLIFGLQWLRKAILRASGLKALHDEDEIFREEVDELSHAKRRMWHGLDWYSFTITFKAVFLEGLEVVFIVLTFGTTQGRVPLAAAGALLAVVVVGTAGIAVHKPLSQVPENTLKFGVGVMLTAFGIFWAAEGAGIDWPGTDIAIVVLVGLVGGSAALIVAALRRVAAPEPAAT
jgi:uncharacterized membrane protein